MKKYIALIASIILVIPFFLLIVFAVAAITTGIDFDDTVLGNLLNED